MKRWTTRLTALAAAACWSTSGAHHSESMFELSALWVTGSVIEFARINPHSIIRLEETTAAGVTTAGETVAGEGRRWVVEGPDPGRMQRRGIGDDFLKPGDVISFCAFPMRAQFSTPPAGEPPFSHGHLLVMPDGKMQIWGSYGRLRNCVRPDDPPEHWADFLNSNLTAWISWCRKFTTAATPEETEALVEEISSRLTYSCD